MIGPQLYARTMTAASKEDKHGNTWQYHPRSDSHSKYICWAILFDLLTVCSLFRKHAADGKVGFGINHEMRDFRVNRKKDLDLVVCTPADTETGKSTLADYAQKLYLPLTPEENAELHTLPKLYSRKVGNTLVALEAKACMTEHLKARPRLYDELSSSYQTILGDTKNAIAAGFVSINAADSFISPLRNSHHIMESANTTYHKQPHAAKKVLEKVGELPRRANEDATGFDAIGVSLISCKNDGSTVEVIDRLSDGTVVEEILRYEAMVNRISAIYTSRFRAL